MPRTSGKSVSSQRRIQNCICKTQFCNRFSQNCRRKSFSLHGSRQELGQSEFALNLTFGPSGAHYDHMKILTVLALFLSCIAVWATGPEYHSSCTWVLERCPTNQVSAGERVFIATTPGSAGPNFAKILRYRKSLTIRKIVDQTRFRGTNAAVTVLRSQPGAPVFDAVVKNGERPSFALKPLDMIWIGDSRLPRT